MSALGICFAVVIWTGCLAAIWGNWHDKWAHTVIQVAATIVLLMFGTIMTLTIHDAHEASIREHKACAKTFGKDSEACTP